jgi:hypothetical protein
MSEIKLVEIIDLCQKAKIKVPPKTKDVKTLHKAAEQRKRFLVKNMGRTIAKMGEKNHANLLTISGLTAYINETMHKIKVIDRITVLLNMAESTVVADILDFTRSRDSDNRDDNETDESDSDEALEEEFIFEQYGDVVKPVSSQTRKR